MTDQSGSRGDEGAARPNRPDPTSDGEPTGPDPTGATEADPPPRHSTAPGSSPAAGPIADIPERTDSPERAGRPDATPGTGPRPTKASDPQSTGNQVPAGPTGNRPASPGGLNSVGMNSGSGHANSNPRGKRARTTGDVNSLFCDFLTCDLGICDCNTLLKVSVLLRLGAALLPATGSGRGVLAALRFYRRHLTRFTPTCPSTPSCSAYAQEAVTALGPRRGLAAAAARVRACGRPGALTVR